MKEEIKIGFISLGCPKNQLDTEVMLGHLVEAGYTITPDETEANIVIINTCAFIESAKRESIDQILAVAELRETQDLRGIIVTGCLAERYRDEIFREMPEVSAVLGVGSIHDIVAAVEKVAEGGRCSMYHDHNTVALGGDRIITTPDEYAYLKIAEGCDNRCTYCAIPGIRGKFRSRPMEDILREAKELETNGVKELCLIAQDTTAYGIDLYGAYRLAELLARLSEETAIPWLRILYCYPDKITDELIAQLRDNPRVVPYIDLPVQHIDDRILRRMNRRGGSETIRSAIRRLRDSVPDIVIRSTAIVGFPGEDEEAFSALCSFIREAKFARFGAFPYSREEDTPAYDFPDQIDEQTKQDRYDMLMREQLAVSEEYLAQMKGRTLQTLCEGFDHVSGMYYGRTYADAPEIDGKIYFRAETPIEAGEFVDVLVTEALDYDMIGQAVNLS